MLISSDHKTVVLGVPKTGSKTILSVLSSSAGFVGREHSTYPQLILAAESALNLPINDTVEKIYVFWRDPVDRFMSAANFIRSSAVDWLMRRNPELFPDENIPQMGIKPVVSNNAKGIAATITPLQIFEDELTRVSGSSPTNICPWLIKQSHWIDKLDPRVIVLDYANFNQNLILVATDFGLTITSSDIPRINESVKLSQNLSPSLEARVREYYADDYLLV